MPGKPSMHYQCLASLAARRISKSLRCYKAETLCKPLFYKTVLHWEAASAQTPESAGLARKNIEADRKIVRTTEH
jgi:hypothetical protein